MRHSTAIYLLEGFEARELSPRKKASLDTHLAACAACASRAKRTPSLQDFLAAAAKQEIPDFDQALETVRHSTLRAVRQEASQKAPLLAWARRIGWSPLAVPVAAVAGAVLVGLVLRLPATEETQPTLQPELRAQASPTPTAVEPQADLPASTAIPVEASPRAEAPPRKTRGAARTGAQTASFEVVRAGSAVRIEWTQVAQSHSVSKALDPQRVQLAGRHVVHGSTWSDVGDGQAPGSVTYYLVD